MASHGYRVTRLAWAMLAALLLSPVQAEEAKRLYRWTDAKGVVHFGDEIPAAATKQEHAVLTPKGNVAAVRGRELTPEEAAARAQAEAEAQKRAAYDRSLLVTYSSEKQIDDARIEHLKVLDARIENERKAVDEAQNRLNGLTDRLNHIPDNRQVVRDELERQIAVQNASLNDHSTALQRAQAERGETETRFAADVQRFRELRQARDAGTPPPS